eukprot:scaffold1821_cov344-Pavlova_lutheri.AAC.42
MDRSCVAHSPFDRLPTRTCNITFLLPLFHARPAQSQPSSPSPMHARMTSSIAGAYIGAAHPEGGSLWSTCQPPVDSFG